MEHLKMLRLLTYLLGLLILPSVTLYIAFNSKDQLLCVLHDDEPRQCGSYCLSALNVLFNDTDNIRTLDEIKAELKAGFDSGHKQEHKEDFANSIQALQAKLDVRLHRMVELRTTKIVADANDEPKSQVSTLNATIKDLQSQLKISKGQTKSKEDILNVKEDQLKERDEQISTLTTQIEAIEKIKSELSSQLSELRNIDDELKISEGQIKIKEDILKVKEENLKNRDEQISDLRTQIEAIEKTKSEQSSQLSELHKYYDILPDSCPSDSPNGIYQIKLRGLEPFNAPCATSPPGWTVIQRRVDGSENFKRTWNEYKSGFGNVSREFFIGLEKLHRMTEARPHELYIKLGKLDGSTNYAHYDDFKIGSEKEYYKLKNLGTYSGKAGDSLSGQKNENFSTFDRENGNPRYDCAFKYGAWWHNKCSLGTLNGNYFNIVFGFNEMNWWSWQNNDKPLTFVEMMIRPKSL